MTNNTCRGKSFFTRVGEEGNVAGGGGPEGFNIGKEGSSANRRCKGGWIGDDSCATGEASSLLDQMTSGSLKPGRAPQIISCLPCRLHDDLQGKKCSF